MGYKRGVPESGAPPARRPNRKHRKPEETGPARRLEGAEAKPEGALRVLKRQGADPESIRKQLRLSQQAD